MTEKTIDDCVKLVNVKRGKNEGLWLVTDESCKECPYVGMIKIYHCRSKSVYDKLADNGQLELPYGKR